jgi:hypothetical protein
LGLRARRGVRLCMTLMLLSALGLMCCGRSSENLGVEGATCTGSPDCRPPLQCIGGTCTATAKGLTEEGHSHNFVEEILAVVTEIEVGETRPVPSDLSVAEYFPRDVQGRWWIEGMLILSRSAQGEVVLGGGLVEAKAMQDEGEGRIRQMWVERHVMERDRIMKSREEEFATVITTEGTKAFAQVGRNKLGGGTTPMEEPELWLTVEPTHVKRKGVLSGTRTVRYDNLGLTTVRLGGLRYVDVLRTAIHEREVQDDGEVIYGRKELFWVPGQGHVMKLSENCDDAAKCISTVHVRLRQGVANSVEELKAAIGPHLPVESSVDVGRDAVKRRLASVPGGPTTFVPVSRGVPDGRWVFATVVQNSSRAGAVGVKGYYILKTDGGEATIEKTGYGRKTFSPKKVQVGTSTLSTARSARIGWAGFELTSRKRTLAAEFVFLWRGAHLYGYWRHRGEDWDKARMSGILRGYPDDRPPEGIEPDGETPPCEVLCTRRSAAHHAVLGAAVQSCIEECAR